MPFLANSSTSRGDPVSPSDTPPEAPLHGLRVLDLSRYFPGPLTGRELVRLGAFVVKVEVGSGDPAKFIQPMDGAWSVPYRLLNGGKAACQLDLREDAGRLKFMALAKRADVVIESFRPGRLSEMGLSPETLLEANPSLVIASLSGFGQGNQRGGHDLGFLARSGVLAQSGPIGSVPPPPGIPVGDLLGGTYPALLQILAALYRVRETGRGVHLDINMSEELERLAWIGASLSGFQSSGKTRGAGMLTGGLSRYRVYVAQDDSLVAVGALEEKFWEKVIDVLAEVDPSISKVSSEAHLEEVFASRDGEFWREKLIPLDVCVEMVESPRPTAAIKPSGHASLETMLKGWDIETEVGNDGFSLVEETQWVGQS